ncbi:MAG: (p)ppGpp synthetase [Sphingobacteriaceae bacterium]|nr:(p)ppGpp synthetase [Sphingobacteriaceae bacterium]
MNQILKEYKDSKHKFENFGSKMIDLLSILLKDNNLNYHQITSRIKTEDSLSKKIESKNGKYSIILDITDIVGIRIITYFEDEVDKVAEIISKEFHVDKKNSVDKRISAIDKFGYQSLHYIVKCLPERTSLTEWKKFEGLPCEIQIRSILQHAWAEIEHDIGYKGASTIPQQEKRNFFRIAALLETADKEFVRLRSNLLEYELEVPKLIKESPQDVLLDKASLTSYIQNSSLLKEIENSIAKAINIKITKSSENLVSLIDKLEYVQIQTIKDLEENLLSKKDFVIFLATEWLGKNRYDEIMSGISIFYLAYTKVVDGENLEMIKQYFETFQLGIDSNRDASRLLESYKRYKNSQ